MHACILGVKDYELKQLIQDDILSCHPEPIPTCFKLGQLLKRLAQRQEERYQMYNTLAQVCTTLAVDLLGQARDMWDVSDAVWARRPSLAWASAA